MTTMRAANGLSLRTNQLPLTSAVPTRSENAVDRHRIFDAGDDAARRSNCAFGKSVDRRSETMRLLDGDESERVGEGEMGFGVGVEDSDAEPVLRFRRQDHRKLIVEDAPEPGGAAQAATAPRRPRSAGDAAPAPR